MGLSDILTAVFLGFGFVSWVFIANYSGASAGITSMVVMGVSALVAAVWKYGQIFPFTPNKTFWFLVAGGLVNGIAVVVYSNKITSQLMTKTTLAAFITMVSVCMAVTSPILNSVINGVVPTTRQLIGFCFAIAAIVFLGK
ncbi:MAG: hypothetical protein Athens071426_94 [Parcubacteria group bacterium Athens0714_26]|nr:MAG: hypothetical protein Athens101426_330 [Parcubacteria group bacterium Athens1014_26]TSD03700.1 MAG: hypothetical protein Athens071426_94 [Parcubacteria group bacterium Athens0714_26]